MPSLDELPPWEGVSQRITAVRAAATAGEADKASRRSRLWWFPGTVVDVVRKSDRDRLLGMAAENAFFAVLTLFPALLAATTVLGQLQALIGQGAAARVERAVLDFLDRLLTDQAGPVIETVGNLFESSGNALTLATLLALVSVSTAFAAVVNTVTIAYDVPEHRGWWRRRWLGLLLGTGTVIAGAIAVTLLVVGPLFGRGLHVVERLGLGQEYQVVWDWGRWPVAFLTLVLWAVTMYHFTPPERGSWRGDLPGGLLAALLWLLASVGLNVYLQVALVRSPILGALGGGLILMTWFYLLCAGLLIGAELNAVLRTRRRHRARTRGAAPADAPPVPAATAPPATAPPATVVLPQDDVPAGRGPRSTVLQRRADGTVA